MNARNFVLCDIDHCLTDAFWRDSMIGAEGGWDAYHEASIGDKPVEDVVRMINALAACGYRILGLTARPEKWRDLTSKWLMRHGVLMHGIIMRADDAFHPSKELKPAMAIAFFGSEAELRKKVALILDDREDVIERFRALNITGLQVSARRIFN